MLLPALPIPTMPSPPARETAAASAPPATPPIGALIIGASRPIARDHSVDNVVTVVSSAHVETWWSQSRPARSGSVIRTIRIRHSLSDALPSR